ncbi:type VI secretion lipoprotein TssJ [Edwardsiella ictaluri]|uniref:type VI secretion lipoprotein TssJ n=1 Tax=Edwardsiella ictaluri TaxID=67780 RepID=UPI0009C0F1B2|nr:type VI secretion lipoprotein TssJ [Edwardsiella ictaluri]ARD38953.1 type VI secretion protein [Edwardsiella ictaluri]QPW27387.1 type VI secretion lipoprotein TssJ [Edwardsiella ictaluri]
MMKNKTIWGVIGCLLLSLTGCSSDPAKQQARRNTQWLYGSQAVLVNVQTAPDLNSYDGESHSLVLAVVQARSPDAFYQLIQTSELVGQVLQGGRPPDGILQVSRYALEPGHDFRLVLDRLQEAHLVGLIAAFYGLPVAQTSRLFDIPVKVTRSGILFPDWKAAPSPIALNLKLGNSGISEAVMNPVDSIPSASAPTASTPIRLSDISGQ